MATTSKNIKKNTQQEQKISFESKSFYISSDIEVMTDESWVFDSLICFLHSPSWNAALSTFIEEKSLSIFR